MAKACLRSSSLRLYLQHPSTREAARRYDTSDGINNVFSVFARSRNSSRVDTKKQELVRRPAKARAEPAPARSARSPAVFTAARRSPRCCRGRPREPLLSSRRRAAPSVPASRSWATASKFAVEVSHAWCGRSPDPGRLSCRPPNLPQNPEEKCGSLPWEAGVPAESLSSRPCPRPGVGSAGNEHGTSAHHRPSGIQRREIRRRVARGLARPELHGFRADHFGQRLDR